MSGFAGTLADENGNPTRVEHRMSGADARAFAAMADAVRRSYDETGDFAEAMQAHADATPAAWTGHPTALGVDADGTPVARYGG